MIFVNWYTENYILQLVYLFLQCNLQILKYSVKETLFKSIYPFQFLKFRKLILKFYINIFISVVLQLLNYLQVVSLNLIRCFFNINKQRIIQLLVALVYKTAFCADVKNLSKSFFNFIIISCIYYFQKLSYFSAMIVVVFIYIFNKVSNVVFNQI